MPMPRAAAPPTTAAQRRLLFHTWQHTGNVTLACRTARVGRRTFYYWKPRFLAGGFAALDTVASSAPKQPQLAPAVAEQVVALRRAHPRWGKRRIAQALAAANGGVRVVSATTVQRLLVAAGLWTVQAAPTSRLISAHFAAPAAVHLPLVATKLLYPRASAGLVERERLMRALDDALAHRLTLLSAGAGWGKTTLLSAWARRQPHAVAWLSLDPPDNDPTRFWIAVIVALRTYVPGIGAVALAMLQAPEPVPVTAVLTVLLNDLTARSNLSRLVLIIDDCHVLDDAAIHDGVTYLVEHLPPQVHLILASRVDPEVPLARWRVRGDLLELRDADLRFTAAEATAFFTATVGEAVTVADVQRLHARTEGWVAGLQLAALALRQRADRAAVVETFTGSHRYLMDYVQQEILAWQPPAVQRFVLQTAVLRRMNAAVCAALTDDPDSQARLEWLERTNLFVVPLDEQRHWYRMHDLLRDVLLARLQATEPALVPQLHQRAARWYAAQDELREAITHALDGQAFALAAELIARVAPELWLHGEAQTVQRWLAALPDATVRQHVQLQLEGALRLLESNQKSVRERYQHAAAQVAQTIARVEAGLSRQGDLRAAPEGDGVSRALADAEEGLLRRRINLLRAWLATRPLLIDGDVDQMRTLVEQTAALTAEEEEVRWKLIAISIHFNLVAPLLRQGEVLVPRLLEVKQQAIAAGDQISTLRVMSLLATVYGQVGRRQLCEHECRQALALSERFGAHTPIIGYFHLGLAWSCNEANQFDDAVTQAQLALQIGQQWQNLDLLISGWISVLEVALSRRDLETATAALDELDALVGGEHFATHARAVAALRVAYWMATGNLEAARAWAAQVTIAIEPWDPQRDGEALQLIKVQLACQDRQAALATIDRFRAYLDRPGDLAMRVWFLALEVVALHQTGQAARARAVAARLITLTERDGYIRVFLEAGAPMHDVLQSLYTTQHQGATGRVPASRAFVARVLAAFAQDTPAQAPPAPPVQHAAPPVDVDVSARAHERTTLPALAEPLTPREQEVLGLLLTGASNSEIATALVIARATVKKHVGNVLAKLGVTNRAQAIAHARDGSPLG